MKKGIKLKLSTNEVERVFSFEHALRLLRYQEEKQVPKDARYELVDKSYQFKDNDIKRRPSKRGDKVTEDK